MKTKVCILVLFSAILVAIFSFSSFAVSTNVIDDTGVLPFDATIEARLESISEKHNIHVLIYAYTYKYSYGGYEISDDDILEKFNLSTYDDVVLLVYEKDIHSYEWHCFLSTYGRGYDEISDSEFDYLMRDGGIMDDALTEDMRAGTEEYLDFIDRALSGNGIPIHKRLFVPILLALLGALIAFLCVFIPYKRKVRSDTYPLKEFTNMDLTYSDDQFTGTTVTRRHVPRSSGSSRSGGGGGSRGGRRGGR